MGKRENTGLYQQEEISQNKLSLLKNIFKNFSTPTTLLCEVKSIKTSSIKAVQKNPRGFT